MTFYSDIRVIYKEDDDNYLCVSNMKVKNNMVIMRKMMAIDVIAHYHNKP